MRGIRRTGDAQVNLANLLEKVGSFSSIGSVSWIQKSCPIIGMSEVGDFCINLLRPLDLDNSIELARDPNRRDATRLSGRTTSWCIGATISWRPRSGSLVFDPEEVLLWDDLVAPPHRAHAVRADVSC